MEGGNETGRKRRDCFSEKKAGACARARRDGNDAQGHAAAFSFCLFQLSMTILNLSLLSSSGFSSLRRAVSVCMNLLKGVSFLRPPEDEERRFLACADAPLLAVLVVVFTMGAAVAGFGWTTTRGVAAEGGGGRERKGETC